MSDEQEEILEAQVSPLETVEKELSEYKDKYFRALAEGENTRKRLQREKIESQSYAVQSVILDLLHPLDHFEQALRHLDKASDEVRTWGIGFTMILDQLKQVLNDHGVTGFDSKGSLFDPHLHEAIETEETESVPEGTILEEFVRGYQLANRVIRPARVKVATAPQKADAGTQDQ